MLLGDLRGDVLKSLSEKSVYRNLSINYVRQGSCTNSPPCGFQFWATCPESGLSLC